LTVPEFDTLASLLRSDWQKERKERLLKANPKRERGLGGGRKPALETLEDQLLLTMVWLRLYSVYLILEYLFGIDESTVSRTIRNVLPLLQDKFTLPERLPRKKIKTIEELKELLPDIDIESLLGDATEQPILRPKDGRKRKPFHSGKKRRFTAKTQIAVTNKGFIVHVSKTVGGRMHDYNLFKKSCLPQHIPKDLPSYFDSGYQGIQKDFPDLLVLLPCKRARNKSTLSRREKTWNKAQRKVRIKVEHTIAQLKKYQILCQNFRHSLQNYNLIFRFVANLLNFRMLSRKLA
jgi:hypothetical protein